MAKFQFTHPGKGATAAIYDIDRLKSVSIHAPWEGCDLTRSEINMAYRVSIHAPWEGCD